MVLRRLFTGLYLAALTAGAVQAEPIRVAHGSASFGLLQLFVAEAEGYFQTEGLEVEFISTGSASKTVAALVAGAADFTVTSTAVSLNSQQQGIDMVVFAALIDGYHTPVIFTKDWAEKNKITQGSPISQRLAALKGARIATAGPGGGDEIIRFYSQKAGLDPDRDLMITHLGSDINVYIAAIAAGQIDGFAVGAPASFMATRELGGIFALNPPEGDFPEIAPILYVSAMGLRDWVASHATEVAKLSRSFQKALDVIQDPVAGLPVRDKVHAKYYPTVSAEIFAEAWDNAKKTSAREVKVQAGQIEKVADFVRLFGEINLSQEQLRSINLSLD